MQISQLYLLAMMDRIVVGPRLGWNHSNFVYNPDFSLEIWKVTQIPSSYVVAILPNVDLNEHQNSTDDDKGDLEPVTKPNFS